MTTTEKKIVLNKYFVIYKKYSGVLGSTKHVQ